LTDARLVTFQRCLRLGYLAHFTREWVTLRPFWTQEFRASFEVFGTPGAARLALVLFFMATLAQLVCSVLALLRPTRVLLWLCTLGLMLEAVVMPIAMPNHVALMLAALTFQAVMLLWRKDEPETVRGLTAILIAGYACAALHKMNHGFLDVLDGVLGQRLPRVLVVVLGLGAVGVELGVPLLALCSRRARPALLLLLLALHFPMNSTLGAIDYPWIATSFYPLFFLAEEWAQIERELARWQRSQLLAAAGSVLLFVLLTPRDLFIYQAVVGAAVSALWGYALPSLLRRAVPRLTPASH
jgi:hypothetical protein